MPKVTILHFSTTNVGMIFEVVDFDPEKNRKKSWSRMFGVQYTRMS